MKPKAEALLKKSRENRLTREKMSRKRQRMFALTAFYEELVKEITDHLLLETGQTFPFEADFLERPNVVELLKEDSETISKETWTAIKADIRDWMLNYHKHILQRLVGILDGEPFEGILMAPPADAESNVIESEGADLKGKQKAAPSTSDVIHGLTERLSLISSLFCCTECDTLHRFPDVVEHLSRRHSYLASGLRAASGVQGILTARLADELGVNTHTSTWNELDHESNYMCLRCDDRLAPHRTFSELVSTPSASRFRYDLALALGRPLLKSQGLASKGNGHRKRRPY